MSERVAQSWHPFILRSKGDLIFTGTIFTGTPAGVGPVKPGDRLEGAIAGLGTLHITIGAKEV